MRPIWWIRAIVILLIAAYAVPYLLLATTERWSGAFLFWVLFGAAVWTVLIVAVSRWKVDGTADSGERAGGPR